MYYNDNLLRSETETITGSNAKTVTYAYDADGNRASTTYPTPESYAFGYSYTGRNQLQSVNGWATYGYDENGYTGDLTSRILTGNQKISTYLYDTLDRVTWLTHSLNGTSRGFGYGYQSNTNNQKYVQRTGALGNLGDVFNYDLADQTTGVQLNMQSPQTTPTPAPNITYDPNGNRTSFHPPYVSWETYGAANDLSQYTTRTISGIPITAAYDNKGNLTVGLDGSTYGYDAQNRLTSAAKSGGTTMYFTYDGLNRQVSRKIGVNGTPTFNVWDGWNLIEEYQSAGGGTTTAAYLYGATGLISGVTNGQFAYYFQDASGSTSHLTDANGNLLEWYRYDLQGTPVFYNSSDQQVSSSAYGVSYLFTGQQWRSEIGLYDLRNRFYSPNIGRFLQPDPIGFRGDATNLYRYCRNNSVTRWDPLGLGSGTPPTKQELGNEYTYPENVRVYAPPPNPSDISHTGFLPGSFTGGSPFGGFGPIDFGPNGTFIAFKKVGARQGNGQHQPTAPPPSAPPPSAPPPQNPAAPSAPAAGVFTLPFGSAFFSGSADASNPASSNNSSVVEKIAGFGRDHLSLDANINAGLVGGNLGFNSKGIYGSGGAGPGGIGEATVTLNLGFGEVPRGGFKGVDLALGNVSPPFFPAARVSFGYSQYGKGYFNFGLGFGPAVYGGVTWFGGGGYIYLWDE